MSLEAKIRSIIFEEHYTLTKLAENIATAKQKHYTIQNLSSKLRKGTLNIKELEIILSTLGYDITLNKIKL